MKHRMRDWLPETVFVVVVIGGTLLWVFFVVFLRQGS